MLVVLSGREVLLEKRPPSGIWGGMWSLPEVDADATPVDALAARWGIHATDVRPLERFEHAFTHFTLEVTPWRMRARHAPRVSAGNAAIWLGMEALAGAPLPSPVRRLLASIDWPPLQGKASVRLRYSA